MKKELFGGVVFFSIVIGMNYILKHFLDEYNQEDDDKKKLIKENQHDIVMEQLQYNLPEDLQGDLPEDLQEDLQYNLPGDLQEDLPQHNEDATINVLNLVVDVLETKFKDDIVLIQQILDKKQHLIDLNARLFEIKERLQELKDDLVK